MCWAFASTRSGWPEAWSFGAQAWRLIGQNADAGNWGDGSVAAKGALVPLTTPLTIGPGTIAAAISLGAAAAASPHALVHLGAMLLAILLLAALIAVTYGNARRIVDLLGKNGSCALPRWCCWACEAR